MRSIHYFPRYSQRENVVTNNSLLLLVRLHQFSRLKFEDLIEKMCADKEVEFAPQWLRFSQQVTTTGSVIDGFIAQDSLKIAVETKMGSSFRVDQLEKHLSVFGNEQHKLLILLSPSLDRAAETAFANTQKDARALGIHALHISFENLIERVRELLSDHDEEMHALIDDFEDFCNGTDLLPTDEYTMFVPPCGQSFLENEEYQLYYCPADWNRRKAKYLGVYAGKRVRAIGRIAKVVACSVDLSLSLVSVVDRGTTLSEAEQNRILGATEKAPNHHWDIASGHRFYLCDDWASTHFAKVTAGGIQGHRYFDLRKELGGKVPHDITQIAEALRNHTWQ